MKMFSCIILAVCVYGCGLTGGETSPPQAGLYMVNLSPDAPALSVELNTTTIASGLTYEKDTGYVFSFPAAYDFSVSANGSTLVTQLLALQAGKYYSLFMVDSFSRLKAVFIEDTYSSADTGYAKVRLFNFVPNSPSLDVSFTNIYPDTANSRTLDTLDLNGRYFNDQAVSASKSSFANFPPATYKLSLYQADTSILVKEFTTLTLTAGKYYTIYLKGLYNDNTLPMDTVIIRH